MNTVSFSLQGVNAFQKNTMATPAKTYHQGFKTNGQQSYAPSFGKKNLLKAVGLTVLMFLLGNPLKGQDITYDPTYVHQTAPQDSILQYGEKWSESGLFYHIPNQKQPVPQLSLDKAAMFPLQSVRVTVPLIPYNAQTDTHNRILHQAGEKGKLTGESIGLWLYTVGLLPAGEKHKVMDHALEAILSEEFKHVATEGASKYGFFKFSDVRNANNGVTVPMNPLYAAALTSLMVTDPNAYRESGSASGLLNLPEGLLPANITDSPYRTLLAAIKTKAPDVYHFAFNAYQAMGGLQQRTPAEEKKH